jgi:hypothetical protein
MLGVVIERDGTDTEHAKQVAPSVPKAADRALLRHLRVAERERAQVRPRKPVSAAYCFSWATAATHWLTPQKAMTGERGLALSESPKHREQNTCRAIEKRHRL